MAEILPCHNQKIKDSVGNSRYTGFAFIFFFVAFFIPILRRIGNRRLYISLLHFLFTVAVRKYSFLNIVTIIGYHQFSHYQSFSV